MFPALWYFIGKPNYEDNMHGTFLIDEMKVWYKVLTEVQIQYMYKQEVCWGYMSGEIDV